MWAPEMSASVPSTMVPLMVPPSSWPGGCSSGADPVSVDLGRETCGVWATADCLARTETPKDGNSPTLNKKALRRRENLQTLKPRNFMQKPFCQNWSLPKRTRGRFLMRPYQLSLDTSSTAGNRCLPVKHLKFSCGFFPRRAARSLRDVPHFVQETPICRD